MLSQAHIIELNRFTDRNSVGVEKTSCRMKIMKELEKQGLIKEVTTHAGFTYFTKIVSTDLNCRKGREYPRKTA